LDAVWANVLLSEGHVSPQQKLAYVRQHWFLPLRYHNPFHTAAASTNVLVRYDAYDRLVQETLDAVGNRVTDGERDKAGNVDPTKPGNDYRCNSQG
jgi:pyrroloquinoline quinone (PQQ) biosynthesis protein C